MADTEEAVLLPGSKDKVGGKGTRRGRRDAREVEAENDEEIDWE